MLCPAVLFYSEKQTDGGVVAVAGDGGDVPTLRDCPDWLCKPFSAPHLAPALKLVLGLQSRNGPVSRRAGFLHSSPLWHIYTMSALELVGARVDAWRSLSVIMQRWRGQSCGLMLRGLPSLLEQGVFPTLVQGRGFSAGCIPPPLGLLSSFAPLVSQTEVTAVSTV